MDALPAGDTTRVPVPEDFQSSAQVRYRLRRRSAATYLARLVATGVFKYHRIVIEGAEHLPRQGPGLILPKHRAYRDILIEGLALHRVTGRYASYVMKAGLVGVLGVLGGVKIVRPKDLRRLKDRAARRQRLEQARAHNTETLAYLDWLYRSGELVVSHPEGMRRQDELGPLQKEIVEELARTEKRHGLRLPMVPVGLEYESYSRPGSRVFFRVGAPMFNDQFDGIPAVMQALADRIASLSGMRRS